MTLGIGSYTLPWHVGIGDVRPANPLTQFDLLQLAIDQGVAVAQYCENLSLLDLEEQELAALVEQARSAGVALEVGTRGLHPTNLQAHALLAAQVGSPFVRLVIDSAGDEPSPTEAVERIAEHADTYRDLGVKLAIENHDRFSAETFRDIVRALGRDWVGICLDTANSLGCLESPVETIVILARDALCFHAKDIVISREPHMLGFLVSGTPAGQGMIPFPAALTMLHEEGFRGSVILEQWTTPQPEFADTLAKERAGMIEGLRFLRRLV